jgi:hypothetical protein
MDERQRKYLAGRRRYSGAIRFAPSRRPRRRTWRLTNFVWTLLVAHAYRAGSGDDRLEGSERFMNARSILCAVSIAAGSLYGCGVDDELASPLESTVESEATVWCTDKSWLVESYAEPAQINLTGWLRCDCYRPQTRSGTMVGNFKLVYDFTCSLE